MGMHTCVQTWDPFKLIYDWKHNQYMRHTGHTVNTKIDQFNSLPLQVFHRFPRRHGNSQCFGQGTPTSEAVEESEFVGTVEVDERVSGGDSTIYDPWLLKEK
jgi:hypothetical protein